MKNYKIIILLTCLLVGNSQQLFAEAVHHWLRTNPGGGGAIATVGATASGILVAAADLSGAYRSIDDGKHWEPLGANQGLNESNTITLAFHPTDGNIFFVGTPSGAYKTRDGGNHFTQVHQNAYVRSIAIAQSNPDIGYITHQNKWDPDWAHAPSEVYKTTDGGNSWHAVVGENFPGNLHIIKLAIHPANENVVYALTGKARFGCSPAHLYRSEDGGIHWIRIGSNLGNILDFDFHPSDLNVLYLSTLNVNSTISCSLTSDISLEDYLGGDFDNPGALYKSTNNGLSFTKLTSSGQGNSPRITGIISINNDNPNSIGLANILFPYIFPDGSWQHNPEAGFWESNDGGQNWIQLNKMQDWNAGYAQNTYFALLPGFYGFTKTVIKDQFNADNFYGTFGQWVWASFDGGVSFDNITTKKITGTSWLSTGVENIVGNALDVNNTNPNIIYMGGYDIGFWYSRDHGKSWRQSIPDYHRYQGFSWFEGGGSNVSTLLNDPKRENVVWASFSAEQYSNLATGQIATTGLFKSTEYGENWQLIGHGNGLPAIHRNPANGELIPNPASIRLYGLSLDIQSPVNNRTLYMTLNGDVFKSTSDGQSWTKKLSIGGGLKFTAVDQFNSKLVYAGGKKGLWRSTDAGETWNKVGIPEMEADNQHQPMRDEIIPTGIDWLDDGTKVYPWEGIFDIKTDPHRPNRVYVTAFGQGKGLYRSDDAGNTWKKLLNDNEARGIAIAPQNSNLIYVSSSKNYYSGGTGNSAGILYSTDAGEHWTNANNGMAWNYGGMIEVETGNKPHVWAWSPGTGIQHSLIPGDDSDGDGINNLFDNCLSKANERQRDTDHDGYGNVCDADLDNNGFVSFADLEMFRSRFGSSNSDADFDGNGSVSFNDLNILRNLFGQAPGPAAGF